MIHCTVYSELSKQDIQQYHSLHKPGFRWNDQVKILKDFCSWVEPGAAATSSVKWLSPGSQPHLGWFCRFDSVSTKLYWIKKTQCRICWLSLVWRAIPTTTLKDISFYSSLNHMFTPCTRKSALVKQPLFSFHGMCYSALH